MRKRKKQIEDEHITIRLNKKLLNRIRAAAESERRTLASYLRVVLEDSLPKESLSEAFDTLEEK